MRKEEGQSQTFQYFANSVQIRDGQISSLTCLCRLTPTATTICMRACFSESISFNYEHRKFRDELDVSMNRPSSDYEST